MKVTLNYELTVPLGYFGDVRYAERNLLSNRTPENEVIFYSLNIWNWSQLRGKNKIMVYTVTLNPPPLHHFIVLLEADGQIYKRIWNTKDLWTGELLVLFKLPTLEKLSGFYLQAEAIRSYNHFSKVKWQQHSAESSSLPLSCFNSLLYVSMVYYHSKLQNVFVFFLFSHPLKWI